MATAILVTEENTEVIKALNNGGIVTEMDPSQPTYFIFSDDPEVANYFMPRDAFLRTHSVKGQRNYLIVDKI